MKWQLCLFKMIQFSLKWWCFYSEPFFEPKRLSNDDFSITTWEWEYERGRKKEQEFFAFDSSQSQLKINLHSGVISKSTFIQESYQSHLRVILESSQSYPAFIQQSAKSYSKVIQESSQSRQNNKRSDLF